MSLAALCAAALGGLWICQWRGRVRLLGVPVFVAGLAGPAISTPPNILVVDDGALVAVRDRGGAVYLSPERGQRFAREMWLRYLARWRAPAGPRLAQGRRGRSAATGRDASSGWTEGRCRLRRVWRP